MMMVKQTFEKAERLHSKKLIDKLFGKGNRVLSQFPFRILWVLETDLSLPHPAQFLVAVPKKNFKKTVQRNRIKRQIREIYRSHKHGLYQSLTQNNKQLLIGVIYSGNTTLAFDELNVKFELALKKLIKEIEKTA